MAPFSAKFRRKTKELGFVRGKGVDGGYLHREKQQAIHRDISRLFMVIYTLYLPLIAKFGLFISYMIFAEGYLGGKYAICGIFVMVEVTI